MTCLGRCVLWLAMIACSSVVLSARAEAQCPAVQVGNSDGNYIVPGVQGAIAYRHVDGRPLLMDAYVQRLGFSRPAVVLLHGGGWDTGSRVAFTGQFQELLTRSGYAWFAIDYRLNGLAGYEAAVDDVAAAVSFVRCHAATFRIDPANIVLLGEDAGAQLALLYAARPRSGIRAVVSVGGFYDLARVPSFASRYAADLLRSASPSALDLSSMPPTFLVHGGQDQDVLPEQAGLFCDRLRGAGRACTAVIVPNAIHRAENWWPSQWSYKTDLVAWLTSVTGLSVANHEPYRTRLEKQVVFNAERGLTFDAFTPAGEGPFPAVIIAHGGGWEAGDRVTYVTPLFEPLARAGFAWFSIDYRLTPEVDNRAQIDDLKSAVAFVRQHATRWRIDPNRVAVLGESASGQLVTSLAATAPDGIRAVVSFYGVYDFLQMSTAVTPRSIPFRLFGITDMNDAARDLLMSSSPLAQARPEMPPMLLIQGTADRLHAQAVTYAARLAQLGVAHKRYDVEGAPHGVENWEGHAAWLGYKDVLVDWLTAALPR